MNGDRLNVNTATLDQLIGLLENKGIAAKKAKNLATAIVKYRTDNGIFTNVRGLLNVKGIDEAILEKIQRDVATKNLSNSLIEFTMEHLKEFQPNIQLNCM